MTPFEEVEALHAAARASTQFRTVMSRAYYTSYRKLIEVCVPFGFSTEVRGEQMGIHTRLYLFVRSRPEPVLRRIGVHLIRRLFKLRVKADYEFAAIVDRAEADDAVEMARDIHDWIDDARRSRALP